MPYKNLEERKQYQKEYHAEWYKKNKEKRDIQVKEYEKTKPEEWRKSIGRKFHLNKIEHLLAQIQGLLFIDRTIIEFEDSFFNTIRSNSN